MNKFKSNDAIRLIRIDHTDRKRKPENSLGLAVINQAIEDLDSKPQRKDALWFLTGRSEALDRVGKLASLSQTEINKIKDWALQQA